MNDIVNRLRDFDQLRKLVNHDKQMIESFFDRYVVIRKLYEHRIAQQQVLIRAKTFLEDWMTLDLADEVGREIFLYGLFERGTSEFLMTHLTEGDRFLDVGAHFGYYTKLAASRVGAAGQVIGVEPSPRTYAILEQNAASHSNVTLVRKAVSAHEGAAFLADYGPDYGPYATLEATHRATGELDAPDLVPVETVSLADLLAPWSQAPAGAVWIKLDMEGHEKAALEPSIEALREFDARLIVEIGGDEERSRELYEFLRSQGLSIVDFEKEPQDPQDIRDFTTVRNLLALFGDLP